MRAVGAESVAETRARLVRLTLQAYEQLRAAARAGTPYPKLYDSGVVYRKEARGKDDWRLPDAVLKAGHGDCEDLVAFRCAELWMAGIRRARPEIKRVRPGLKHAFIELNGKRLDPSRKLGMRYLEGGNVVRMVNGKKTVVGKAPKKRGT